MKGGGRRHRRRERGCRDHTGSAARKLGCRGHAEQARDGHEATRPIEQPRLRRPKDTENVEEVPGRSEPRKKGARAITPSVTVGMRGG